MISTARLRGYWFKPSIVEGYMVHDIENRFNKSFWLRIKPNQLKQEYPGICLFSRLERRLGYVKCWLYSNEVAPAFQYKNSRDLHIVWVDPSCLVEVFSVE